MTEPRLQHQQLKIRELIDDYRAGRVVIPEFQREYVWKRSKAPRLVDSLYQGFPISSLLFWISSEEARSRRAIPRPSRSALVSWLIDGQQRVITLSRALNGDEGIDVVFNPDEQSFALANAATRRDQNWFRLAEIWDDSSYRELRRNLPEGPKGLRRESRFERVRQILDYEIPVVRMMDYSFKDAVDAFKRINTLGVKLKREDIESAQVAAQHTGFIADEVSPFLDQIRRQGFSRINVMHLFRVCAFIARPDGRNRTPLHELSRAEVQSAWTLTKRATLEAMGLIRSELGLVNMDVLWSGALLVPVIAMCATIVPRERDAKSIAAWLAIASLLHRYSVSTESALDQDLRACRASDPIGALLTNVRREEGAIVATSDHFSGALQDRGGMLGMYVACLQRGVKDLFTGGKMLLQPVVDRHHILPRAQFSERRRARADCIANIAFVNGATNKSINNKGPEVYLKTIREDVLQSQCIPMDEALWRVDRAEDFWTARRELLADAFNEYIKSALPNRQS